MNRNRITAGLALAVTSALLLTAGAAVTASAAVTATGMSRTGTIEQTKPGDEPGLSAVYSDGDRTVSIRFKSEYRWSDGTPVTAEDLLFDIDLIKAALTESPSNCAGNVPGGFPATLASASEPTPSTLVLHLTRRVNPAFFTEDVLGQGPLVPLPVQSWARTSVSGPAITDWKTSPADALKIYRFLVSQNDATGRWASNPLWKVVDGPYRLSAYNDITAEYTLVPNTRYGGPHAAKMSVFHADQDQPMSTQFRVRSTALRQPA